MLEYNPLIRESGVRRRHLSRAVDLLKSVIELSDSKDRRIRKMSKSGPYI